MSTIPYTALKVNQGGIDTYRFNDCIYLMAPALKGGQSIDEFGLPMVDSTGRVIFTPKMFGNLADFENEFGLATAGSPASIYAQWIFDQVAVPIVCRRVISSDLASASVVLKDATNNPIFWIESKAKTDTGNRIMIDISRSSLKELFLSTDNVVFSPELNILKTKNNYLNTNTLIFDGTYTPTNQNFRYIFKGKSGFNDYTCFDFTPIKVADEKGQYIQAKDNVLADNLIANEFSYNRLQRTINFGAPPLAGSYFLAITGITKLGDQITLALNTDGISKTYKINFEKNNVEMNNFFVDGFGIKNKNTQQKILRFFSINTNYEQELLIECKAGTITDTTKVIISQNIIGQDSVVEVFDNVFSYNDAVARINSPIKGSNLVKTELWLEKYANDKIPFSSPTYLKDVGFKLTVYLDGYSETYDNLHDIADLESKINYKSALIRGTVLQYAHNMQPKLNTIGLRLRGGNAGLNPTTVDYLNALWDAEKLSFITLVIAPGVADPSFHALLKNHCTNMYELGKYRQTIIGGELNETIEIKKQRGLELSSERVIVVGDGLVLTSPVTGENQLFSPAIAIAAFTGQILKEHYYISQTNKIITQAKGIEHEYDPAQLEELHIGKIVLFQKNKFGIQIVDGITTSHWNAYEDIHMVRIFDTISRNVKQILEKAIGQSNMPPTWMVVISQIRRLLEFMQDSDAISDFNIFNNINPEDLIDRRYKLKIGIIPVFPIKYVEGYVDIFPPYAIET